MAIIGNFGASFSKIFPKPVKTGLLSSSLLSIRS